MKTNVPRKPLLWLFAAAILITLTQSAFAADTSKVDMRIRAYQELLKRPAPEGLDLSYPKKWLADAESLYSSPDSAGILPLIQQTERWFANESSFAWLSGRVNYLALASKILGRGEDDVQNLHNELDHAKDDLNAGVAWRADIALKRVNQILSMADEKVAGGKGRSMFPEKQRILTSWLKDWNATGYYFEPTPKSIRWKNGPKLIFDKSSTDTNAWYEANLTTGFSVYRTWTSNHWKGKDSAVRFSVLSPLVILDLEKARKLSFDLTGVRGVKVYSQSSGNPVDNAAKVTSDQAAVIDCADGKIIMIPDAQIDIVREGEHIGVASGGVVSIAVTAVPASANTGESVKLWARIAAAPPAEVVQTYQNGKQTLYYTHLQRKHPAEVKPLKVASLPPLAEVARQSGWKLGIKNALLAPAFCDGNSFRYFEGDKLTLTVPQVKSSGLHGANLALHLSDVHSYRELAWRGATSVRLLVDEKEVGEPLVEHMTWCRENGIKANVDLHFQNIDKNLTGTRAGRKKWADTWAKVAEVCQAVPDALKCYDIGNEPFHEVTPEMWLETAQQCIDSIRTKDKKTPILVEAPSMADYWKLNLLLKLKDPNLIYGTHVYTPHHYTYGRYFGKTEFGDPQASAFKFYPNWSPQVNWTESKEGWFADVYVWFDTWELAALFKPVYEFRIRTGKPVDVGEFGVCGHNGCGVGEASMLMWLRDAIGYFETLGASWDVWSYNWGGFSWLEGGPDLLTREWREANRRR